MTRLRALVVCPGRGSYGRAQLGSLPDHPILAALDSFRAQLGRPTITSLDRAGEFTLTTHAAGENASLLTFAATALDLAAIDRDKVDIVGVTGNSLGFYTALHAAGALDLAAGARLVETMGHYQHHNVIGGQLMYPIVDDDWRPSPALAAVVDAALDHPGMFVSIRLGGTMVLGGDAAGLAHARGVLPPLERGGLRYPAQLPLHSAFHTPLMRPTAERADLADLALRSPAVPLIAGDGVIHRPWASPDTLWDYTLGPQLLAPYDFSLAIATAVKSLGPDAILLPGPGDSLGAAIAQILITMRWRGLTSRADFTALQASDTPFVLAMARPAQRARIVS
jgi:[acyl-carrier-protein] S-malonyltransferase